VAPLSAETVLVVRTTDAEVRFDALVDLWSELRGRDDRLLFKPNLLSHRHRTGGDYEAVVTQPEVLELAWRAADGLELTGSRAVADAPQGDADFDEILARTGLADWGRERGVSLVDLRNERYFDVRDVAVGRERLSGDPEGAVRVDLGRNSVFFGLQGRTFYGADYDIDYTNEHHRDEKHEYLFSGTALNCGIVINLPKMKTHKKAGVTLSLKNLVGLNADKNLLPHYTLGDNGDAYASSSRRFEGKLLRHVKPVLGRSALAARVASLAKPYAKKVLGDTDHVVRSGNWWGNDTLWRMILDLNRILLYARPDGSVADTPQRTAVSLVDGIVAGERTGPDAPDRVDAGVIVAGTDFVAVDIVATTFMGLDYRKVPALARALEPHVLPLTSIEPDRLTVRSNVPEWDRNLWEIDPATMFHFRPHFGWEGHIERHVPVQAPA
jgi:uncharacterized protein (DUF362 family)